LHLDRRIVQGGADLVSRLIQATQGHGGITTTFIERLNGTFQQRLSAVGPRTSARVRCPGTLSAGMDVVGCLYNLCAFHHRLRLKLSVRGYGHR